jgi:hypothetical protein
MDRKEDPRGGTSLVFDVVGTKHLPGLHAPRAALDTTRQIRVIDSTSSIEPIPPHTSLVRWTPYKTHKAGAGLQFYVIGEKRLASLRLR